MQAAAYRGLRLVKRPIFPEVGLHQCPSEKKAQAEPVRPLGSPVSRPDTRADRRKTAGLFAPSPGMQYKDRLPAGGSRIRTARPT